tara:strand:+ start:696 stop:1055 length:360 start_codon:yes stop_codon:yes gene_type:complete
MYTISTLEVALQRALSSHHAVVTAPPAHHPMQMHNKKRFRQPRPLGIFLLATAMSRNMGRKKKKTLEGDGTCQICGTIAWKNAPMHFLFYEIQGESKAICSECGTAIVKVVDHMKTRWS